MKDIVLDKNDFKLFDQDDQFGFFYDDMGFPKDDADASFDSDVDKIYQEYDSILVDSQDNVFGLKNGKKELFMEDVIEAYTIAREVKNG